MAFHVGQKVVCVDASCDAFGRPMVVVEGHIYTVAEVIDWYGIQGLRLVEVSPGTAPGWYSSRFRPVVERKTDISIFTAMLNPSREQVKA